MFSNLVSQVGRTWGDYNRILNADAVYLRTLGQQVSDEKDLWGFEVWRANAEGPLLVLASSVDLVIPAPGLSVGFSRVYQQRLHERFRSGSFGRGWTTPWATTLRVKSNGAVEVVPSTGAVQRFEPDPLTGTYFPPLGESSTLSQAEGGGFVLEEPDGLLTRFSPGGQIDYVQDSNGNRITASYEAGRLTKLGHSAGQWLAIAYNSAGLVQTINDSLGRTTTYIYDTANEHLLAVQDYRGQTIQYRLCPWAGPDQGPCAHLRRVPRRHAPVL